MGLVTAHVVILFFSVAVIIVADHEAFSWFRGKKEVLDGPKMEYLHNLVWAGLLGMIVTGFILMWPVKEELFSLPIFKLKMFFVALITVNAFFIGKFSHIATIRSFSSLTPKEKLPLIISGGVSTIGWIGATISALIIFD